MTRCFTGCGERAVHRHHVVTAQVIRRERGNERDARNLVPVCFACHAAHHNRAAPFELAMLPDSVFEFAVELLGVGAAYEYLRRFHAGHDERLEGLVRGDRGRA